MLTETEAATNIPIDFTNGDLANLKRMSVAAPQGGASYDGTITPPTDAVTLVPTYRLGGGGKLTLPGAKLTGARNVQISNGGEVELDGANTYTGVTRIQAKYHSTNQVLAAANAGSGSATVYEGATLTANTLLNGGLNSSVGSSTSDASNLVIQGSTLKYVGTGSNGTTNRLFTVGTGGATLDASGQSGSAMNFTSSSPLVMGLAGTQTGHAQSGTVDDLLTNNALNLRSRLDVDNVDDFIIGMSVSGLSAFGTGVVTTGINQPTPGIQRWQVSIPQVPSSYDETGTLTFGGVARTLTLAGSNTNNNTLSPLIANATAATGTNTVNVAKNGNGKWILTGNNTYTGTTSVNAGTLLINGTQSGNGLATVAAGATLGGTGTYGGAVTNNGIIAPGASVGTLNVAGNVTMGNNSHFAVELSGTNADKLAITGNLDLAGAGPGDTNLNYLDVAGIGSGTSWLIATYTGTLTGVFESITPGYSVNYGTGSNSQVTLNLASLPGDFNNDTHLNVADYVTWRKDPTNPNFGGANGYFTWRENFGTAASGSGLGGAAVPEPASLVFVGMALAIGIGGVRRRA
jgi:fibronectin-binding autotransporter adhesin